MTQYTLDDVVSALEQLDYATKHFERVLRELPQEQLQIVVRAFAEEAERRRTEPKDTP